MYKTDSNVINRQYFSGEKSLNEIADESKISVTTIQRLLKCDCHVKHKTARKVYKYFGVDSVQRVT